MIHVFFLWNFRPMAIHIGKIIEKLVKEKGMSVTSFAEEINTTRRNAYKIFEKDVIDTDLLLKIGKVLGKNLFFYFISDEEIIQYRNRKIKGVVLEDIFIDIKNGINRIENKLENKSTQFKTTARHSGKK